MAALQEKVSVTHGLWFNGPNVPVWRHLYVKCLASETSCRVWFAGEGVTPGRLACRLIKS